MDRKLLDELEILGVQKKMSKKERDYISKKTGEILRKRREAEKKTNSSSTAKTPKRKKK